jgi:cystathionine beta-lyase
VENISFARSYLAQNLPSARLIEPEGTYLLWVDCSALEPDPKIREERFDRAGLWLDSGAIFGPSGANFERLNIACPRTTLADAMERFVRALSV